MLQWKHSTCSLNAYWKESKTSRKGQVLTWVLDVLRVLHASSSHCHRCLSLEFKHKPLERTVTPHSLICNYEFLSSNFCNRQALDFGWYLFLWAHGNTPSIHSIHSGERCETSKQGTIHRESKSGEKLWFLSDIKPWKLGYHYLLRISYISYTYEKRTNNSLLPASVFHNNFPVQCILLASQPTQSFDDVSLEHTSKMKDEKARIFIWLLAN